MKKLKPPVNSIDRTDEHRNEIIVLRPAQMIDDQLDPGEITIIRAGGRTDAKGGRDVIDHPRRKE